MAKKSPTPKPGTVEIGGKVYDVSARLTLPVKKIDDGESVVCRLDRLERLAAKDRNGAPKLRDDGSPATLDVADCTDPETGEQYRLVLGTVAVDALRAVPGGPEGYVYALTKHPKANGAKAKQWTVVQIDWKA